MSTRLAQTARLLLRPRRSGGGGGGGSGRGVVLGSCLGLSIGAGVALRSSPRVRFDGPPSPTSRYSTSSAFSNAPPRRWEEEEKKKGGLDPDLMRQLSGGSVTGFLSGLLVSVFSRTLVLLFGVSVVVLQVAARYGIDIVDQLRLKQRLGKSRVLAALEKDPAFKLSFGLFFALSAFMQF
ncbi:putative fun14 family protein [Rosellinia necatrix]|uniref:Putative fun14 family protein n=1 Tax=Rosellinia necatrix TaxID=77044 RepID=A0A1W2TEQ0_ROSNE|nr:putative fun14 family protein [Rosellinia necatrix]